MTTHKSIQIYYWCGIPVLSNTECSRKCDDRNVYFLTELRLVLLIRLFIVAADYKHSITPQTSFLGCV